jgi:hypothetical protein
LSDEIGGHRGHKANPLVPKRGWAGQRHWQDGWEACAEWFFERLALGDPLPKVQSDLQAIIDVRAASVRGRKSNRPKQLRRPAPNLPQSVREFDR